MYVCLCMGVSDHAIREVVEEGACFRAEVMACTGAGSPLRIVPRHDRRHGRQAPERRRRVRPGVSRSLASAPQPDGRRAPLRFGRPHFGAAACSIPARRRAATRAGDGCVKWRYGRPVRAGGEERGAVKGNKRSSIC